MTATQVGMPSMQAALGISVTASQWIPNLTLMLLEGIVTVGGALGDRLGRMRMFRLGLILTIAGAAITYGNGLMYAFPVVLAGRGLEGLEAALLIPASIALLLNEFPMAESGGAQSKMIMIIIFITAFAPTLIGVIIQAVSWPFLYLLTVLSGSIAIWTVSRGKYKQKMPEHKPFDVSGSVLLFFAVNLLTVSIMPAGETGLTSPSVLLLVGAGLAVGAALVILSLRKENPLSSSVSSKSAL